MIGAPNSLNLNCKVRVMKEAPGPSVSEEIADIFTNYNIDEPIMALNIRAAHTQKQSCRLWWGAADQSTMSRGTYIHIIV